MFVFYFSENCVFGVPLTTLLQTDQQRVPHTQIPLIMEEVQICFNPPLLQNNRSHTLSKGLLGVGVHWECHDGLAAVNNLLYKNLFPGNLHCSSPI